MVRMARLLDRSAEGRAATRAGDYGTANAIRAAVLSDLAALDTTHLPRQRRLLARAMRASITANEVRVGCSSCAAEFDASATRAKQQLVAAFNPMAELYLGRTFDEEDI